jgi:hypothetical protein
MNKSTKKPLGGGTELLLEEAATPIINVEGLAIRTIKKI